MKVPWGKYIFISNVLPHGKYDVEYKSCLLPRKQGSVVNIYTYMCVCVCVCVTGFGKPSVGIRAICVMRVFSSSSQNLSKSRFILNNSSNCSCHLRRLVVRCKREISLHLIILLMHSPLSFKVF